MSRAPRPAGRLIHAGLHLLDRQVVDADGMLCGKVDDLELLESEDGGAPYVAAILGGPGALASRFGGRFGTWLASVQERLHPHAEPGPAHLPFGIVKRIEEHVEVSLPRDQLEANRFEAWARDQIIDKIPGARHAAE